MLVVIDTNVLVSSLWSKSGAPAKVLSMVIRGVLIPCFDYRIMSEYREVMQRPKFGFSKGEVNSLLDWFESIGRSVIVEPIDKIFIDEADKKFYEVAKFCNAILITGNLRHFPDDKQIQSVQNFLKQHSDRY